MARDTHLALAILLLLAPATMRAGQTGTGPVAPVLCPGVMAAIAGSVRAVAASRVSPVVRRREAPGAAEPCYRPPGPRPWAACSLSSRSLPASTSRSSTS